MPVLVVEKGHCYRSTGTTGTTGEQDYATVTANAITAAINGVNGWQVKQKLADSGSYAGNAFVALHCDGSTNSSARGSSVGFQSNEGSVFGLDFMTHYAALGWTGGFRPPNYTEGLAEYYGVRNAIHANNRRAIIVECGFMTNPQDKALMTGPGGPERVAHAIALSLGINVTPPQEEDMAGQYSRPLPASTINEEGELEVMSTVIPIDKGGAGGTSRVWVSLMADNDSEGENNEGIGMDVTVAHWRVANPDGTTRPVTYFTETEHIPPLGYGTPANNEAPTGAIMLVVNHVSPNGGAAVIAYR